MSIFGHYGCFLGRPRCVIRIWFVLGHDDVIKWKCVPCYWPFVWDSIVHRLILLTKTCDAELWFFFNLCLNKRLGKQSKCQWFETPSRLSWRQCNEWHILYSPRIIPMVSVCRVLLWLDSDMEADSIPQKRHIVRSRKASKARDWVLECTYYFEIGMRFGSSTTETPAKFQSNWKILTTDPPPPNLCEVPW